MCLNSVSKHQLRSFLSITYSDSFYWKFSEKSLITLIKLTCATIKDYNLANYLRLTKS